MIFLVVFLTFWFMEFVAWATHKFVMHGFLWNLHEDHHVKTPGFFEKNDTFFLIFAIPSWLCIMLGTLYANTLAVSIGAGIAVYGMAYFLVHEVFIHQRFKWFRNSDNLYLKAIRRAHKMHHKHLGKHEGESFGMLVVSWKYFKQEMEAQRKRKLQTS
ncbi:MAG TPA: carotene hydroxylase [Cryomorphaceae bacterium]|nr:carotene hydroxylase [Owenweeksia sp.]HAD97150.1 carotene hydroxylase [Cryomorphaceae bacterium]